MARLRSGDVDDIDRRDRRRASRSRRSGSECRTGRRTPRPARPTREATAAMVPAVGQLHRLGEAGGDRPRTDDAPADHRRALRPVVRWRRHCDDAWIPAFQVAVITLSSGPAWDNADRPGGRGRTLGRAHDRRTMTDLFTPRPEHHFTFGLWTVGQPGSGPVRHRGPRPPRSRRLRAPARRPRRLRRELPRQRPRARTARRPTSARTSSSGSGGRSTPPACTSRW